MMTIKSLFALTTLALATSSLFAQSALKGKFALVERGVLSTGQEFVALGTISIDAQGHASGSEFLRGSAGAADLALDGTYRGADNSLALTYSTANAGGDAVPVAMNYRIVGSGDAMHAIRTDVGVVSDAQMIAIAPANTPLKGQFILNESSVESAGQSFVSLTTLNFDGGQAHGRATRKNFGPEAQYEIAGTYTAGVDGAGTLQLQAPSQTSSQNADGDITTVTAYATSTYRFVEINAKQLVAVRADPGVVTSVEFSAAQ